MALTPFIRAAQAATRTVVSSLTEGLRVATYVARSIVMFPTPYVQAASQAIRGVFVSGIDVRVQSFITRAVIFKWPGNPKVRAWGYSQDGHDFYVLHLGAQGTIVYDATTGAWSQWKSHGLNTWRAGYGTDWIGMAKDNYLGGASTQVVAGDENLGLLWTLNPDKGTDDHPFNTDEEIPIVRIFRGGVPCTERLNLRTNGLWLRLSTGMPVGIDTSINLKISDDQGKTWFDAGSVDVNTGEYGQTIYWRSLGLIRPPGRIFEWVDIGAAMRIDGADIDAGDGDKD